MRSTESNMTQTKSTTITATYRIVTPMFCSGADQQKAEFRLPSFKGALRFWWRSLMWGKVQDVVELRKREAELFGSSDSKTGQSKIRLRMIAPQLRSETQNKWNQGQWQAYAGYGLIETTGGLRRDYVCAGQTFDVELRWNAAMRSLSSAQQAEVIDALIALGVAGGLGGRSRKGWGSLQLTSLSGSAEWQAPTTSGELADELTRLFTPPQPSSRQPHWTGTCNATRIGVGPLLRGADVAHRWISERYRESVRSQDPKRDREAFGLPRNNAGRNQNARRASPLFIHVHEFHDGRAVPVVVCLPSDFLPDQTQPSGGWENLHAFVSQVNNQCASAFPG